MQEREKNDLFIFYIITHASLKYCLWVIGDGCWGIEPSLQTTNTHHTKPNNYKLFVVVFFYILLKTFRIIIEEILKLFNFINLPYLFLLISISVQY